MGRRRFRLSDMMPNSWFYKLRDMRRARGGGGASAMQPPSRGARPASPGRASVSLPHRTSYYYTTRDRELPQPSPAPRPSVVVAAEEDRLLHPAPPSPPGCSRRRHGVGAGVELVGAVAEAPDAPHRRRDMYVGCESGEVRRPAATAPPEDTVDGKVIASDKEIIIDLRAEDTTERVLRPIVTRPARREAVRYELKDRHVDVADADTVPRASSASEKGGKGIPSPRRSSVSAGRRLRTRANSPRLVYRKGKPSAPAPPAASSRKTSPAPPPLAESFAVVKASADPRKDFRESMEEMIAEKGIHDAADLEDLLACYLALNAAEHHDLIVEVFEQIWTSLASVAL